MTAERAGARSVCSWAAMTPPLARARQIWAPLTWAPLI